MKHVINQFLQPHYVTIIDQKLRLKNLKSQIIFELR
jgi:hypothetical protein